MNFDLKRIENVLRTIGSIEINNTNGIVHYIKETQELVKLIYDMISEFEVETSGEIGKVAVLTNSTSEQIINKIVANVKDTVINDDEFLDNVSSNIREIASEDIKAYAKEEIDSIIKSEIDTILEEEIDEIINNKVGLILENKLDQKLKDYDYLVNSSSKYLNSEVFESYVGLQVESLLGRVDSLENNIQKDTKPFELIYKEILITHSISKENQDNFNSTLFFKDFKNIYEKIKDEKYYIEEEKVLEIHESLKNNRLVILEGPPGSGKTKLAELLCKTYNEKQDFTYELVDKSWHKRVSYGGTNIINNTTGPFIGRISSAIFKSIKQKGGGWLILDEWNRGDIESYLGCFINILDTKHNIFNYSFINNSHNEEISFHFPNSFRIIATMNSYEKNGLFQIPENFNRRIGRIIIDSQSEGFMQECFIKFSDSRIRKKPNYELFKVEFINIVKKINDGIKDKNDWIYRDLNLTNGIIENLVRGGVNTFEETIEKNKNINYIIDVVFSLHLIPKFKSKQKDNFEFLQNNVFTKDIYPKTFMAIENIIKKISIL